MRDKIYNAIRNMNTSKTINNADSVVKLGIELTIDRSDKYRMSCPDNPCNTCFVQAICKIKKLYDLSDLNIIKPVNSEKCEKIDLWTEIVKGEEIKEKFWEESGKRRYKDENFDDRNYLAYLAMSINNFEKSEKYKKLLDSENASV